MITKMALPTTIEKLDIDVLQNILARLSAVDFASADCVSRSWNHVCSRILCRPKFASACSNNPSLLVAIEEVANEVLSKLIRPQFAILSVGSLFSMQEAFQLITTKLSSKIPVIVNWSSGFIGRDAFYEEFKKIPKLESGIRGIVLTVGCVPGMKVKSISLQKQVEEHPQDFMIDKFVTDIWEFSTSISGRQSPAALMIFSREHPHVGINTVEKLDYAMSPETVVVGGFCYDFRHTATEELACDAVALVFVADRNKPPGIGETKFHAALSSGLSPVGPTYRVDSVTEKYGCMAHLIVHREGPFEATEMEELSTMYIGVTKRRKCSVGQEKEKWMTSLAFHRILSTGTDNEYFLVEDVGVKTGDTFQCYLTDSNTARSSTDSVSNLVRSFNGSDKWEVSGGLIFASMHRGQPNGDSSLFLENLPGVTFAGTMCLGEMWRGDLIPQESQEQKSAQGCFLHRYNAVYLVMSYAP
ncbi:putative F-box domain-containing protein [Helianthus annuus]|uniref:F-box domain-containing protein n=3 Tax=Helianthus annuus TaxID=4232 RepID=A0A9K3J4E4_HELAN|nr:F-box/LRR-repeat protein At5g63520 isoform X1 [Helianthus annuus]KAF5808573.1 putative F-box domain-containing protein [Helianthus annuus]KAJ0579714.1 putative F-box domain-containing protein [Helianthus annuus]KAJ0587013.1 putative F-box domain-containing protein [Helianthus annuus]KAJ0595612.1 putative F-box domain-containing protein [Helianthus annuus]KAJ0756262.1 putative F-box domain-containing protein [Helianthus annuus]